MSAKLGSAAKLYYKPVATWIEISNVRDLKLNMDKNEADVTTRANSGWKATLDGLKDAGIEFDSIWDSTDTAQQDIMTAFLNNTTVHVRAMDGDNAVTGTQGLDFVATVTKFERDEPLTEGMKVSIALKPAYGTTPSWVTI